MSRLALSFKEEPALSPISPRRELGAYEVLFLEEGATFKKLADRFKKDSEALPSDFVAPEHADRCAQAAIEELLKSGVQKFGVRINRAADYPKGLRDARNPVELLYYQGTWELSEMPSLAIVGSRKASKEGLQRTARLARELVQRDYAVVSGLATGVDTTAHKAALDAGGTTIAVIGTPLGKYYPPENKWLQDRIARDHLLISQIPVLRYAQQPFQQKRQYFPERNATMSALTLGTIIVEAGETSGTLAQARAALFQGRKLFILDSCFRNTSITWPKRFEEQGAVRVRGSKDIWDALGE
ncbi:MAG: DNA-protecting protein DprA [Rhodospirillaceae bacterium]|nr:DNA-protecting protein DprA [Rhodospirillaceae bacterium]